jgi:DNA-binding CsgD family transcriptional regulator
MLESLKPTQLLHNILGFQEKYYAKEIAKTAIIKDNYINEFSASENSVRVIFDHINFKIIHISDNIEALSGYSLKDFYESNILFVLKLITLDHFDFMYVWIKWAFERHNRYGDSVDLKQVMCGIKAKHKNGYTQRLLFRHYTLESTEEEGFPTLAAITIDDITHLMKSDFYWGRIECGNKTRQIHHIISTDKVNHPHDILSDREKSIVKLLAEGKESKEIGAELFISSHTVDNHRRNMINKVGVRDTTGLIQICKMVGII